MDYLISYAQNYEDIYLSAFFPDVTTGHYVDVGANHPVIHSATKRFSLGGWTGINLEPIRKHHNALVLDRPADINLPIGVSNASGRMQFREYKGDGLSTFSPEMMRHYASQEDAETAAATVDFAEYDVEVRTLREVLTEHPLPHLHFMKVDVEGYEYEALEGNDWSRDRPEVICIESNHIVRDWHDMLAGAGYRIAFFDGLNEYFVAEESAFRIDYFKRGYPAFAIYPNVLRYPVHLAWSEREHELTELRRELAAQEVLIRSLSTRLGRASKKPPKAKPLEVTLPTYLRALDRRAEQRLKRWQSASTATERIRSEVDAFAGDQVDELLTGIQAADARAFSGAYRPSPAAAASWRSYRALRRMPRKSARVLASARRHAGAAQKGRTS